MRILVVEDEEDLAQVLARGLRRLGYAVDMAPDGEAGWEMAEINMYDLIVLDLNLPKLDGLEVLRNVRTILPVPVLILTSRSSLQDRVRGLDLGADDYLVKPFHFEEFAARIRALLRRNVQTQEPLLRYGDLCFDAAGRVVWLGSRRIDLTKKEMAILEYLMSHPGRVITEEEFIEHIWDDSVNPMTSAVRVHINSLRRKLGDDAKVPHYIVTLPGQGYKLGNTDSE